jgi:Tfp pilus assembly protein PilN
MRAVNLLPPERRGGAGSRVSRIPSVRTQPALYAAGGLVLLTALVLGLLAHSASSSVSRKQRQLDRLQTQVAATQPKPDRTMAGATAASRLVEVTSIAGRRMPWDAFLGAFARVMPEDVWLLSLTATPGNAVAATSATASDSSTTPPTSSLPFTISGYTYSQASVARLLDRLALIPWLSGVQLQSSSLATLGKRRVYEFSIGASMMNVATGVTS